MSGVQIEYGSYLGPIRTARTVTPINNAQVETGVVKFGTGALELDGVNDALSITPNIAFTTSTSPFTIECWVYPTSTTGARTILHLGNETFGRFIFAIFNNVLVIEQFAVATVTGNITVPLNQWSHIAFVGTGTGLNSIQMYTNGVQNTLSGSVTWTQIGNGALSYIGAGGSLENDYVGYIDEFRISNIRRYTSNFTPPTAPFVGDSNTMLLLHCDGTNGSTSFPDDNTGPLPAGITVQYANVPGPSRTAKTIAAPVGASLPASVSPPQPNLSQNALEFQSATTGLSITNVNANWAATAVNSTDGGTNGKLWFQDQGQFTFELFVNFTANLSGTTIMSFGSSGFVAGYRGAPTNRLFFGQAGITFGFEPSIVLTTNTWYHIALTREFVSGALRLYAWVNGVYLGTATSLNYSGSGNPTINSAGDLRAYIQEFRISNIARYTPAVNFTPPTVPFTNDNNTLFLLHGTSPVQDDNIGLVPGGITITY